MGTVTLLDSLKKFLPNNTSNKLLRSDYLYIERGCVVYTRFKGFYNLFSQLKESNDFTTVFKDIFSRVIDIFVKTIYDHGGVLFKFDSDFMSIFFDKKLMEKEEDWEVYLHACCCAATLEKKYSEFFQELEKEYNKNLDYSFSAGLKYGDFIDLIIGSEKRKDRVLLGPNSRVAVNQSFAAKNGGVVINQNDFDEFKKYISVSKKGGILYLKELNEIPDVHHLPLDDYLNLKTSIMKAFIPSILFKKLKKDPEFEFTDYKIGYVIHLELSGVHTKADEFLTEYPKIQDESEQKIYLDEFYFGINKLFKKISKLISNYDGSINKVGLSRYGLRIVFTFSMPDDFENDATNREVCIEEIVKIVDTFKDFKYRIIHFKDKLFGSILGNIERSNYIVISPLMMKVESTLEHLGDSCITEIDYDPNNCDCIKHESITKEKKSRQKSNTEISEDSPKKIILKGLHNHKVIGRNNEIITLNKMFREGGKIVTVVGEYGSGKTRLVEEIVKRMENENFAVIQAKVENRDNIIDLFKFIIEEYSDITFFDDRMAIKTKLDKYFYDLAKNCPEEFEKSIFLEKLFILYKILYNIEIEGSPYQELTPKLRLENLKEALSLFMIMCYYYFQDEKKGVVFIFDDIDNLKHEEKELLQYVIQYSISHLVEKGNRRNKKGDIHRISFMVTHHLNSNLDFNKLLKPVTIDLAPLKKDTMKLLLKEIISGKKIPSEIEKVILKRAEGNPFYLEQYFRFVYENNLIREKETELEKTRIYRKKDVPEDIKEVVKHNLLKIEPNLLAILQAAAITGVKFDMELIKEYYPEYSFDDFKEVANYNYIKRYFNNKNFYVFCHPIISDVLYEMIPIDKKLQLHANVAKLLEKTKEISNITHPNWMGHHYFNAGIKDKAAKYLKIAYESAMEKHFTEAAYNNLISYLNFFDEGIEKDRLILQKISLLFEMKDTQNARKCSTSLIEKYKAGENSDFLADIVISILEQTFQSNTKKKNIELLDYLKSSLENLNKEDIRLSMFFKYRSLLSEKASHYQEAITEIDKASEVALTCEDYDIYCGCINYKGELFEKEYRFKDGIKLLEDNLDKTSNCTNLKYRSIMLGSLGKLNYKIGRVKKALAYYTEALNMTSTLSLKRIEGKLAAQLANIYLETRELTFSQENLERALKIYRALSDIEETSYRLSDYGELYIIQNNLIEAEKSFNRAYKSAKEINSITAKAYALHNFGRLNSVKKNYDEAEQYFNESLSLFKEKKLHKRIGMVYYNLAEMFYKKIVYEEEASLYQTINVQTKDFDKILNFLDLAEQYSSMSKNLYYQGLTYNLLGKILNRLEKFNLAEKKLKEAVKIIYDTDFYKIYTDLNIQLSKSLFSSGKSEEAKKLLLDVQSYVRLHNDVKSIIKIEKEMEKFHK
ncbi:MAG: DUF2791 family P-loop domain-containing protein [Candidatus Delongbacteria bacterium]|nr:DUF2791 family P-loop domain-containing protein [Candidatus Delongbacteria bacterium]MBN2836943.1 DUF2791 family P-loop domain-containing protein [Candidatus Delongbacteria bacterium]